MHFSTPKIFMPPPCPSSITIEIGLTGQEILKQR